MKINFRGTYKISGDSIINTTPVTLSNFLKELQICRKNTDYSYINKENIDYYVSIKDDKEKEFEKIAKKYNIAAKKFTDKKKGHFIAWNNCLFESEFSSIVDAISRYFY